MSEKKQDKQLKEITVEDLARVIGGGTNDDEIAGGEVEGRQRKSRYPDSKITFPTPPIVQG